MKTLWASPPVSLEYTILCLLNKLLLILSLGRILSSKKTRAKENLYQVTNIEGSVSSWWGPQGWQSPEQKSPGPGKVMWPSMAGQEPLEFRRKRASPSSLITLVSLGQEWGPWLSQPHFWTGYPILNVSEWVVLCPIYTKEEPSTTSSSNLIFNANKYTCDYNNPIGKPRDICSPIMPCINWSRPMTGAP